MGARARAGWMAIVLVVAVACSGSGPWRERTGSRGMTFSPSEATAGSLLVIADESVDFTRDVTEFSLESIEPRIGSGLTLEGAGMFNMAAYPLGGFADIYTPAGEPLYEQEAPLPGVDDLIPLGTKIRPEGDDRFVVVLLVRVVAPGVQATIDTFDVVYTTDGRRHRHHVPMELGVREVDDHGA